MAKGSIPKIPHPVHMSQFMRQDLMQTGVYFLYRADELVYVGQTRTLKWRLDQHLAEGVKNFDSVAFIPCTIDRLMQIEGHYIGRHAPRYNACGIAKAARERQSWYAAPRATSDSLETIAAEDVEMNLYEASSFLRVPQSDVKRWHKAGTLPDLKMMTLLSFAAFAQAEIAHAQMTAEIDV